MSGDGGGCQVMGVVSGDGGGCQVMEVGVR